MNNNCKGDLKLFIPLLTLLVKEAYCLIDGIELDEFAVRPVEVAALEAVLM